MKDALSSLAVACLLLGCPGDDTAPADTSPSSTGSAEATSTSAGSGPDDTSEGSAEGGTTAPQTSGDASSSSGGGSSSSSGGTAGDSSTTEASSSSTGGNIFPDGLACTTVSLCSTYDADPSAPPFPKAPGGTLEDGLYRAVQGTSVPFGLAIAGDRYALIFENLGASYGDLTVIDGVMIQTQTAVCSSNGTVDLPGEDFEYAFWTDGTELFTYSGCDSLNPDVCGSGTRYVRVDDLCEDLGSLGCEDGSCECHTFTDEIPEDPGGCMF